VAEDPGVLPRARHQAPLYSPADGWIQSVDALGVALAALRLGAGRARAEDPVDPAVGVGSLAKTGQRIAKGEALCMVHANDPARMAEAKEILSQAIVVGAQAVTPSPLVGEILG
jgi:thymidine phosphorylase